jgi:hypothetical protein
VSHMMGQNWSDIVQTEHIDFIGVLHYRIEFSVLVNNYLRNNKPDCICVELPYALRNEITSAVRSLPRHSVIIYETPEIGNAVLIIDGSDGVQEAVRSGIEQEIPTFFIDPFPHRFPMFDEKMPDAYLVDKLGQKTFINDVLIDRALLTTDAENEKRETFMAARLQSISKEYKKILFVGGIAHIPGILDKLQSTQPLPLMKTGVKAAMAAPLHPESLKKGFTDIPRITETFEYWRQTGGNGIIPNRHEQIIKVMHDSVDYYSNQTHQEVPDYVRTTWAKFLRKWLPRKGEVLPDLYHLVASARSAMDEDFAYHVHEYLADYPWANDPNDPSAVILNEDNLMYFGHKIILHKKLRTFFHKPGRYRMKAVNSTKWREHLKKKWETADPNEVDICSYPPEDVAIEKWGDSLMKHANHLLQTAQMNSEPFVADFGDGPDVRETLRRFYEKRLYVRSGDIGGLEFGSIVVIFEEDEKRERYPFQMTWLGEHSQESDMAFYSNAPGDQIIGPGISRLEHGGFMLSYPPMRMFDIWIDSTFDFITTRHERLLVAGIVYSEKPGIVYVAKKPPLTRWKKFAKSMGKRIIYIPMGSLNPIHVRRMRTFHMLQNKGIRNSAHDFFKKD